MKFDPFLTDLFVLEFLLSAIDYLSLMNFYIEMDYKGFYQVFLPILSQESSNESKRFHKVN